MGRPVINHAGKRYGRLLVLRRSERSGADGSVYWDCICDCGNETTVRASVFLAKHKPQRSCGCLSKEVKHGHNPGHSPSPTYRSWAAMWTRCTNPNNPSYPKYGGAGISVDDRWKSFGAFLSDMGKRPDGTTLDRIDNSGNYGPGNCRWATYARQSRNRRSTVFVEYQGERMPVMDFIERSGISRNNVHRYLKDGRTPEEIVQLKNRRKPTGDTP